MSGVHNIIVCFCFFFDCTTTPGIYNMHIVGRVKMGLGTKYTLFFPGGGGVDSLFDWFQWMSDPH